MTRKLIFLLSECCYLKAGEETDRDDLHFIQMKL